MTNILLKHVRSFWNPQPISIKPLTLVVGENSTGKTTFLSMLAHIYGFEFPSFRPSFNNPPFDLGPFGAIATFKGGRGGRADSFGIGLSEMSPSGEARDLLATYVNHKGQPQLQEVHGSDGSGEISVQFEADSDSAMLAFQLKGSERRQIQLNLEKFLPGSLAIRPMVRISVLEWLEKEQGQRPFQLSTILNHVDMLRGLGKRVFAFSPVRTRPRRTYDETNSDFDPEGNHVFVLLARLWQERDSAESVRIFTELRKFGESSTLFKKVDVKLLGKDPSDPFQIRVATAGHFANLIDVGYGVSQALPLIVQSLRAGGKALLLLQEPEIHLHPRAQAALGTFFSHLVATQGTSVVIETHSDYLIDRVRSEIARGTISATDVRILFFEKKQVNTTIHELSVDKEGNISGAPSTYRKFFLEEEISLLRRTAR
ncbi:MAG: DUF3696 domain-containing protein [Candidatus Acidiferrales bacterium]